MTMICAEYLSAPPEGTFKNTNHAACRIFDFLVYENTVLAFISFFILMLGIILWVWISYMESRAKRMMSDAPCWDLCDRLFVSAKESTSQFIVSFSLSFILFCIGLWFEQSGQSSVVLQLLTYLPAFVLAFVQLKAIFSYVIGVRLHLGV